jgi:hypothetical protein
MPNVDSADPEVPRSAWAPPEPPSATWAPPERPTPPWSPPPPSSPGGAYPWPPVVQPGGPQIPPRSGVLPAWAVVLVSVVVGTLVVGLLAAIAVPVFLHQRADSLAAATTVSLPPSIENLSRVTGPDADSMLIAVMNQYPDPPPLLQGAVYSDRDRHTLVVFTMKWTEALDADYRRGVIARFEAGVHRQPAGVHASDAADRDAGRLGGRMSCVTLTGTSIGQACVAVDPAAIVVVYDFSPSLDTDLPRRAREAVEHRR